MRALASFVMKGRLQAALVVALFAVLWVMLPPVLVLSGAPVALVTLRRGPAEGGLLVLLGAAGTALLSGLALGMAELGPTLAFLFWLPIWAACLVLRRTISLSLALQCIAGIAIAGVLLLFMVIGDPVIWWQAVMGQFEVMLSQSGLQVSGQDFGPLQEAMRALGPVVLGGMVHAGVLFVAGALLLGRWWQALLFNPGGFGEEFRALRLTPALAVILAVLFALAFLAPALLAKNLAVALVGVCALYGLAVVHGVAFRGGFGRGWLVALYVLMLFALFPILEFLSVLALVDTWVDFRRRTPDRSAGT